MPLSKPMLTQFSSLMHMCGTRGRWVNIKLCRVIYNFIRSLHLDRPILIDDSRHKISQTKPRWAPCWPRELCYLGSVHSTPLRMGPENSLALAICTPIACKLWGVYWEFKVWSAFHLCHCISICNRHPLTHWGQVMHICVSKLTIIGSDNGLLSGWGQAIILTSAGILLTGPLGINLWNINKNSYIFIKENTFYSVFCEMSAILSWPQCVNFTVSRSIGCVLWVPIYILPGVANAVSSLL